MKKYKVELPTFLEMYQTQRKETKTPRGGSHKDKKQYSRKEKHKKDFRNVE